MYLLQLLLITFGYYIGLATSIEIYKALMFIFQLRVSIKGVRYISFGDFAERAAHSLLLFAGILFFQSVLFVGTVF